MTLQPAASTKGRITFDGTELVVRFDYSKRRFSEIKRIRSARYDKQQKCWRLPVTALDRLEQLKSFGANLIDYDFDREAVQRQALEIQRSTRDGVQRICENPFFVSEADIRAANVDVVFRLHESPRGIRAEVRRYSRARSLLEAIPAVHFLKRERSYFFPVEKLHACIRQLRDKNILFAVEEGAGQQLRATAELRRKILEESYRSSWQDLRGALLVPFIRRIESNTGTAFALCEYTTDQLRELLPASLSYPERKALARSFSESELLQILNAARNSDLKVWLEDQVQDFLSANREQYLGQVQKAGYFDDELLAVALPDLCWCVDSDNAALLISKPEIITAVNNDYSAAFLHAAVEIALHWAPDHRAFRFADRHLIESFDLVQHQTSRLEHPMPTSRRFSDLLAEVRRRKALLERQDSFHAMTDCSIPCQDSEISQRLFPHQRVAVRWLTSVDAGLFGDDMGLGKTLSILTAFHIRRALNEVEKTLVVCPQSLVSNWEREFLQWFPQYKALVLSKEKKRQAEEINEFALNTDVSALIVNFETFRLDRIYTALVTSAKQVRMLLVVDESQRVKNATSRSFQALAAIAPSMQYRYLLSGTPTPRDVSDIWSQMYLVDLGERFGSNYFEWLKTVAELGNTWSEYAVTRFLPEAVQETISRVHEVLLRRKKETVVDLPEKLFVVRDVALRGEQKKRYTEVCDELLLRVTDLKGDEGFREIQNVMEEYLRAVQIASNPRLIDEQWKGDPAKFIELDSILDEVVGNQNGKVVIWTNYLRNVAELEERYTAYGVVTLTGSVAASQRAENIRLFQSTDPQAPCVFIAIPAAGGVGITLTAAQTVVYLDKSWNAEHYLQSIDRVHRIGQTGTVTIVNLHACPVDSLIARNLRKKERNQASMLGDGQLDLNELVPSKEELIAALSL